MEVAIKTLKKEASEEEKLIQVPTGGSHQRPVPSSQHCQATWSGHAL